MRSPTRRDATSPRIDPNTRISKPSRPRDSKPADRSKYLTHDEQSAQFVKDEDKFVLKQSKKKAVIRVREGRARPIDYLAFNLKYVDPERDIYDEDAVDANIDVSSPIGVVEGLNTAELTGLESDITDYIVLETNSKNRQYWRALKTLCGSQKDKVAPRGNEGRVVSSVSSDIDKILAPKTLSQLEILEGQIKAKLRSDEDIDTDYWEQLLRSLRVWKAKASLAELNAEISREREALRAKNPSAAQNGRAQTEAISAGPGPGPTNNVAEPFTRPIAASQTTSSGSAPPGTERFAQADNEDLSQTTTALYEREVARGVTEDEEVFAAEETVTDSKPMTGGHRARKPRYFNRVAMGYEWNKYNQTHYDHDNPPPKVVQGYKFNIFYPELIDKTKAPTFKIIREHGRRRGESFAAAGETDTCLIRFISGAPYEDIAFRIVDREWDYSAKRDRGYKSSFDKVGPPPCLILDCWIRPGSSAESRARVPVI